MIFNKKVVICLLILCVYWPIWADTPTEKALVEYNKTLKTLAVDDEKGYAKLLEFCKKNGLKKEEEEISVKYQKIIYKRELTKFNEKPTVKGCQQLLDMCLKNNWLVEADSLKIELTKCEYNEERAKIAPTDLNSLLAFADKNKLAGKQENYLQILRDILLKFPNNPIAREGLGFWKFGNEWVDDNEIERRYVKTLEGKRDAYYKQLQLAGYKKPQSYLQQCVEWVKAPVGLLKNQKVAGRTEGSAWYHISVPKDHANSSWPLIVYLHGGGLNAGSADGMVALAEINPLREKVIMLFPNHIKGWWCHPYEMAYVLDTLTDVMLHWHIDPKRIYLMGDSMGGNGTWAIGSHCTELFAALSPGCGDYKPLYEIPIEKLATKPVRITHGVNDNVVPIAGARNAFAILKKLNAPVEMHEFDCGHQLPMEDEKARIAWLLQYVNPQTFDMKIIKERIAKVPVQAVFKADHQYP